MRQALVDDVHEAAVALVEVEAVRGLEIVCDVQVRPAVVVDINPYRRVPLRQAPNPGLGGDIGEGAVAVVVEQVSRAPLRGLGKIEDVGDDVAVEETVAVIIGEHGMNAGVRDIEAIVVGAFGERSVAIVDEQQVRRVVAADVKIGPAVLVDVHRRHADVA